MLSGLPVPVSCLGIIFLKPKAVIVHIGQIALGRYIALCCRKAVPFKRFLEILRQAIPCLIHPANRKLSICIAQFCSA